MVSGTPLLSVVYTGEPDVRFEFGADGMRRHFGRDEERCEIVIWSAINGQELSRVAGCLWRMDGELWVRNLSTRHELYIEVPGRPPEQPLPPRRDDHTDRGAARAVPGELAFLRAPAGCELLVRQLGVAGGSDISSYLEGSATLRVPPVPERLLPVAAALCEPLLQGGQLPATYAQIRARSGLQSLKRVRNFVNELCSLYADEVPALRERVGERLRREAEQLGLASDPRLRRGVWTFDAVSSTGAESPDVARRRALALPDYYEVAHLLVRRRLVSRSDLASLPESGDCGHE